jgi:integrase
VPYARGVREHRFDNGRYLFQHGRRALTNMDLNACMRFLLHGMVFIKDDGEPVAITSHRLRHVVATYLLQVEEVPIDIVAEILKHKHLATTAYYAKATPAMVGERLEGYLARFAGVIVLNATSCALL